MTPATNSPHWPLLDVDGLYVNGWLEDCNKKKTMTTTDRTSEEIMAIITQRNTMADYQRGFQDARSMMGTGRNAAEGIARAEADIELYLHAPSVPASYLAGYRAAVTRMKERDGSGMAVRV